MSFIGQLFARFNRLSDCQNVKGDYDEDEEDEEDDDDFGDFDDKI